MSEGGGTESSGPPRHQRLRAVVDVLPDLVIVYDEDGVYRDIWRGQGQILVAEPEEMLGQHVTDLLPAEPAESILGAIERTVETGESQRIEYRLETDEESGWFEGRTALVDPEDAERREVVMLSRDVTERRERERDLQESHERYRSLFENNPLVIWEEDLSGVKQHLDSLGVDDVGAYLNDNPEEVDRLLAKIEVIDVNRNALDYYRAPSKDVLVENIDQLFTEEATESFVSMLDAIAAGETRFRSEIVSRTLDGERRNEILDLFVPEPHAEDYSRVYVTVTDITDRKEKERELRHKNERLEEFASVVSHDLRNPLNVATGRVELARAESESEHLESAAEALARMETLIEDLLALARKGDSVSDRIALDLADVLEACWDNVDTADATLVVETDLSVRADPGRLRQLLENLLANAVDHGGDDVTVTVGDLPDGFYVADDGPGIPADERDRIFESGYSTAEEGTGFGLAIVREIAEAHGWAIAVRDSETGGARFEITGVDTDE